MALTPNPAFNGLTDEVKQALAARRPGYAMPAVFYRSESIYALEWERIFYRCWIYAGHASQIPAPGDYFVFALGQESVIVVRNSAGAIQGFANVCRHRGSRVCLEAQGNVRAFVCPYHGWAYDLDGRLKSKRRMAADFNPDEFGLKPVAIAGFEGLLFLNLGDDPSPFDASAITEYLAPFDLSATRIAACRKYSINANWKLALENYHECYHCAPAHLEYSRSHSLKAPDHEAAALRQTMQGCATGIRYATVETAAGFGMELYYGRYPLYSGYLSGTEDGKPAAPLLGQLSGYDGGASDVSIGAFSFLLIYSDYAVVYCFKPQGVQSATMELSWLVRADAQPGVDYDHDRLVWLWDITSGSDQRLISNNQCGINSRYYSPGRLSQMETYLGSFHDWYATALTRSPWTEALG